MKQLLQYFILPVLGMALIGVLLFRAAKNFPLYFGLALGLLLLGGLINARRSGKRDKARGWRIGREGRDAFYYEELHGEQWERIDFYGDMLVGIPRYQIYLSSVQYPPWAKDRKDQIVARIKGELSEPDYRYQEPSST